MTAGQGTVADLQVVIRSLAVGEDASAFRTLNEEWITRHFALEPADVEVLSDPQGTILNRGGAIYMACMGAKVVGCVALVPMSDRVLQLAKMAVSPGMRGRGIGRKLLLHAVAEARRMGARRLFLGSNRKLADAVHLYETVGFQHVPENRLPAMSYTRADVFMEMEL